MTQENNTSTKLQRILDFDMFDDFCWNMDAHQKRPPNVGKWFCIIYIDQGPMSETKTPGM